MRTAQVIAALEERRPDVAVHVRTAAPGWLFEDCRAVYAPVAVDSGVVESADALRIDGAATVERLREFLRGRGEVVEREVEFVREQGVRRIVADIPFLAGEIAGSAGVECIGISNFTWNWILEPYLREAGDTDSLSVIEGAYGNMRELWQPGLSQPDSLGVFRRVRQVPAIARKRRLDPKSVRERLGIEHDAYRAVVFVASRGRLGMDTLLRAATGAPEFLFLVAGEVPAGLANVRSVALTRELNFSEVVGASDVVVSKLGYGTVVECMSAGKRLLYPPREGFAEDEVTEREAPRFLNLAPIPLTDYAGGEWRTYVEALLRQPPPREVTNCRGAEVCAEMLAER
ncbi:MAG: hypothetical protein HY820_26530 [Acidobacteria bacterium]|nr:hypothetical protein [Acidobacteriota bacterium]